MKDVYKLPHRQVLLTVWVPFLVIARIVKSPWRSFSSAVVSKEHKVLKSTSNIRAGKDLVIESSYLKTGKVKVY